MLTWPQFYAQCKGVRMPQPNEGDPMKIVIGKEDFDFIVKKAMEEQRRRDATICKVMATKEGIYRKNAMLECAKAIESAPVT